MSNVYMIVIIHYNTSFTTNVYLHFFILCFYFCPLLFYELIVLKKNLSIYILEFNFEKLKFLAFCFF